MLDITKHVENTLSKHFNFSLIFKCSSDSKSFAFPELNLFLSKKASNLTNEHHILQNYDDIINILIKNFNYLTKTYNPYNSFFILYDLSYSKKINDIETYFNAILYNYDLVGICKITNNIPKFMYNPYYLNKYNNQTIKHNSCNLKFISHENKSYVVLLLPMFYINE